jgi:hypothetical protein
MFQIGVLNILNISNKLLVSLDILLEMGEHIKRGEPPGNTSNAVILAKLDLPSAPIGLPWSETIVSLQGRPDTSQRSSTMATSLLKYSQRGTGTRPYAEFVVCAQFSKVETETLRIVHHFHLKW